MVNTNHETIARTAIYAAIARIGNSDAGHVCYAHSMEEARTKASRQTSMTVVIRRELATAEHIAALVAVGKL